MSHFTDLRGFIIGKANSLRRAFRGRRRESYVVHPTGQSPTSINYFNTAKLMGVGGRYLFGPWAGDMRDIFAKWRNSVKLADTAKYDAFLLQVITMQRRPRKCTVAFHRIYRSPVTSDTEPYDLTMTLQTVE